MCCNYRWDIFTLLILLVFLMISSELQINSEDVFRFWGNETSTKSIVILYSSEERQLITLINLPDKRLLCNI